MSHFLRLPLEIRVMIYEYCLIVDHVIDPYPSAYEFCKEAVLDRSIKKGYGERVSKPELPTVSILRVSVQLHREASPILYGKNCWKHPQWLWNTDINKSVLHTHQEFFKDMKMCFDWREGTFWNNYMMMEDDRVVRDQATPQMEREDHEYRQHALHRPQATYNFIYSRLDLSHLLRYLDSLVIDVAFLYCSVGCCRAKVINDLFQSEIVQPLVKNILRSRIKTVKIVGLRNELEEELVYGKWGFQEDGTVDRAAMAKKWELDFPVTDELDLYDREEDMYRMPCWLCVYPDEF